MACVLFGAGDFFGLCRPVGEKDLVIAADAGWRHCLAAGAEPTLLLGDFDSLPRVPDFPHIRRVPVRKDDTDMMLAIKEGLAAGEREFYIYGGMGGARTDHTLANLQGLLYLAHHGARGWLYGRGERYTALTGGTVVLPAQEGIFSLFCMGAEVRGLSIAGGDYPLEDAVLTPRFSLGVSNHFIGRDVTVSLREGDLVIGIHEGEAP